MEAPEECERLLRNTKRQVKRMMEEAAARKCGVHEDSGSILALCVTVDACLTHRLKRRALGLFKTSSSTALIRRIAAKCPEAAQVLEQLASGGQQQELAASSCNQQQQQQQQGTAAAAQRRNLWIKRALLGKQLVAILEHLAKHATDFYEPQALMASHLCSQILVSLLEGPSALEFSSSKLHNGCHQHATDPSAHELMRRHQLANRVACLCANNSPPPPPAQDSPVVTSRQVQTSSSTAPTSSRSPSPSSPAPRQQARRRPLALRSATRGGTLATDCHHYSCQERSEHEPTTRGYSLIDLSGQQQQQQPVAGSQNSHNQQHLNQHQQNQQEWAWANLWSPSMLHETLHQNARSRLLYAKNNVLLEVQAPGRQHVPGYLSLHETTADLLLNWIPNQMIKGGHRTSGSEPEERAESPVQQPAVQSCYLELVVSLSVSRIVLIQCQFQATNQPGQAAKPRQPEHLTLVEADGVQLAPFKFPKGGLRQFLACLDGGLRPRRRLEPAVWLEAAPALASQQLPDNSPAEAAAGGEQVAGGESQASIGALESLLRRLPSLKQRPRVNPETAQYRCASDFDAPNCDDSSPANYVYRIVSSPPNSPAPSAANNATVVDSSAAAPSNVEQATADQTSRFQWGLKRLAQLSYRYSNSSSTASSAPTTNQSAPAPGTSDSATLATLQTSLGGDSSLDSFLADGQLTSREPPATGHASHLEHRDSSRELAQVEAKLEQIKKSTSDDVLVALRTQSIQALCDSMRKQILARAFYGWLAHCRRARIIRLHLRKLVKDGPLPSASSYSSCLTLDCWQRLVASAEAEVSGRNQEEALRGLAETVCSLVYQGGIESDQLRRQVWPYLLEHYSFCQTHSERAERELAARRDYENQAREWAQVERVVKQRDREVLAANIARAGRASKMKAAEQLHPPPQPQPAQQPLPAEHHSPGEEEAEDSFEEEPADDNHQAEAAASRRKARARTTRRYRLESTGSVGSDASITDHFGNNMHRIDKDVQRCDRNFWYFKEPQNLNKLRNIMCTYVWQHLDMGYVQGMCDLAAPLLVILDDECLAYSCFCQLMKRMVANFPHGRAMDEHFDSLKHLMQIMDPKLFEILESNGDYAHFYFCYRWLLLDFKRELVYEDVYKVWETIWAARFIATDHFVVFMALAMVRYYRDIIIDNNMDFTDTIKFFNEMAERHDTKMILTLARDSVVELQYLIKNY